MFFLLTLTVPLVLVWLAAWLAEELEAQRALVAALADAAVPLAAALEAAQARVAAPAGVTPEAMQRAVQAAVAGLKPPDLGRPLDRLIIGQSRIEAALQRLAGGAAAGRPARPRRSAGAGDRRAGRGGAQAGPGRASGAGRCRAERRAPVLARPGAGARLPARRRRPRGLPGAEGGAAAPGAGADAAGRRGRAEPAVAGGRLRRRAGDGPGRSGRLAAVHRRGARSRGGGGRRHPRSARDRHRAAADRVRLDLPRTRRCSSGAASTACSPSSRPRPRRPS